MSSTYTEPRQYLFWQIDGDRLGIFTIRGDGSTQETKVGDIKAIDEAVAQGILIEYDSKPSPVVKETDEIDLDPALHIPLANYIKSKLVFDSVVVTPSETSPVLMAAANKWESDWRRELKNYATRMRDRVGGTRAVLFREA